MKIHLSILIGAIALAGCSTPPKAFEIKQTDSRFDTSGATTVKSDNNRISKKSVAGGVYLDGNMGVFLNPALIKSNTGSNTIIIDLVNATAHDTVAGDQNMLGKLLAITFLSDDGPIKFDIENGKVDFGTVAYNYTNGIAGSLVIESGRITVTKQQYEKIMNSQSLAVKISGTKNSVTFENNELSSTFISNLKLFYSQELATL